ncbi:MAG TPA: nucleotide sugar dehydrogenase, partial [Candidatus Thalassarchaeaceae archaeon]|nr:nucleotide sugar dehydrogenase [Candidatus Thalassarchaeaceae archaeon]
DTLTSGGVTYVGAIEVAEAAKVVENVQRDLNIALVNELARIFPVLGIDVEDVLDAAATKWNFHRYRPGVGVGGHCIPVDPYYLIQKAKNAGAPVELITSARQVNSAMPSNVAVDIAEILAKFDVDIAGSNVLLLGWSYKPGIGDPRETPAEPLAEALVERGCIVQTYDPLVDDRFFPTELADLVRVEAEIQPFDIAILVTAHDEVVGLDWGKLAELSNQPLIYDGRRVLDVESLKSLGWSVYLLGAPL